MRAVRLVGLADSGRELVCEDPNSGERFLLARDDRLRAAARGDLSRFGEQLQMDGDSQLRPKEIQARIRSGATVEAVAALAGTSIRRIERFAHPVLLERSTVADKARRARPTIDGIHSATSVEEAVTANLTARGHEGELAWDAYRDDNDWVLLLTWTVGRSVNRAQWTYHPGPAGGTLTARDENAADIVDPALRVLRPLVTPAAPKVAAAKVPAPERITEPVEQTVVDERAGAFPARVPAEQQAVRTGTDGGSPARPTGPTPTVAPSAAGSPAARATARKGNRPAMPSWEDVLLGTRATGR